MRKFFKLFIFVLCMVFVSCGGGDSDSPSGGPAGGGGGGSTSSTYDFQPLITPTKNGVEQPSLQGNQVTLTVE
ncbi:hypothetical protein CL659_03370 [bacterium]|nr:hypothetical protein [bacterium]|tara:strand:- start:22404 stop:22622 length:219 start_codon:yes stop_codon:yes gene_type:complete